MKLFGASDSAPSSRFSEITFWQPPSLKMVATKLVQVIFAARLLDSVVNLPHGQVKCITVHVLLVVSWENF